jgi:hypothetical protein
MFGNDCEVQVTPKDSKKYYVSAICKPILENFIINFLQAAVIPIAVKADGSPSINPSCGGNALTSPFFPTTY